MPSAPPLDPSDIFLQPSVDLGPLSAISAAHTIRPQLPLPAAHMGQLQTPMPAAHPGQSQVPLPAAYPSRPQVSLAAHGNFSALSITQPSSPESTFFGSFKKAFVNFFSMQALTDLSASIPTSPVYKPSSALSAPVGLDYSVETRFSFPIPKSKTFEVEAGIFNI